MQTRLEAVLKLGLAMVVVQMNKCKVCSRAKKGKCGLPGAIQGCLNRPEAGGARPDNCMPDAHVAAAAAAARVTRDRPAPAAGTSSLQGMFGCLFRPSPFVCVSKLMHTFVNRIRFGTNLSNFQNADQKAELEPTSQRRYPTPQITVCFNDNQELFIG